MKILLVEHQAIVREGLKQVLGKVLGPAGFGEAESSKGALALVQRASWDLVIADIALLDSTGLDVMQLTQNKRPKIPVLVLGRDRESRPYHSGGRTLPASGAGGKACLGFGNGQRQDTARPSFAAGASGALAYGVRKNREWHCK